jgi:hypothetical protein
VAHTLGLYSPDRPSPLRPLAPSLAHPLAPSLGASPPSLRPSVTRSLALWSACGHVGRTHGEVLIDLEREHQFCRVRLKQPDQRQWVGGVPTGRPDTSIVSTALTLGYSHCYYHCYQKRNRRGPRLCWRHGYHHHRWCMLGLRACVRVYIHLCVVGAHHPGSENEPRVPGNGISAAAIAAVSHVSACAQSASATASAPAEREMQKHRYQKSVLSRTRRRVKGNWWCVHRRAAELHNKRQTAGPTVHRVPMGCWRTAQEDRRRSGW